MFGTPPFGSVPGTCTLVRDLGRPRDWLEGPYIPAVLLLIIMLVNFALGLATSIQPQFGRRKWMGNKNRNIRQAVVNVTSPRPLLGAHLFHLQSGRCRRSWSLGKTAKHSFQNPGTSSAISEGSKEEVKDEPTSSKQIPRFEQGT